VFFKFKLDIFSIVILVLPTGKSRVVWIFMSSALKSKTLKGKPFLDNFFIYVRFLDKTPFILFLPDRGMILDISF
jgi:hypothetical protein